MALALVAFGAGTRGGVTTMVDYLSPVYWLFMTLSGVALLVRIGAVAGVVVLGAGVALLVVLRFRAKTRR